MPPLESAEPAPFVSLPRHSLWNFAWLIAGRVLRLGLSLTVGAWIARHLAPEEFGELSYLLATVALPAALAGCGLDGLIVRELLNRRRDPDVILGTAIGLRLGAGFVLYVGLVGGWWLIEGRGIGLTMIALLAMDLLFQASSVFDFHFQARSANKWTVLAGTLSLLIASAVRVALILGGATVEHFAAAVVLEGALLGTSLALFYRWKGTGGGRWRFKTDCARELLAESWPMIVSAVAIAGYMRVDQVMLKALAGEAAVGVYAVAVRLGEAWYFLPMFLGTTLNPWIVQGRALGAACFHQRLLRFYAIMFWSSLGVAFLLALAAEPAIRVLFGDQYLGAVTPLRIHVLGGVLLAVGVAAGKWYVAEGHTMGLMRKALCGLAVNVAGNALLIPRFGISGAAAAGVAGQFTANVLYDIVDSRVRPQLTLKLRALAPWTLGRS